VRRFNQLLKKLKFGGCGTLRASVQLGFSLSDIPSLVRVADEQFSILFAGQRRTPTTKYLPKASLFEGQS
jgi:hypothetical protein